MGGNGVLHMDHLLEARGQTTCIHCGPRDVQVVGLIALVTVLAIHDGLDFELLLVAIVSGKQARHHVRRLLAFDGDFRLRSAHKLGGNGVAHVDHLLSSDLVATIISSRPSTSDRVVVIAGLVADHITRGHHNNIGITQVECAPALHDT